MFAKYNLGTDYRQSTEQAYTAFGDEGWEYTPGPKEIDVQVWGGETKILLNSYVSYLNTEYDLDVTGDLISVSNLGDLGCTVPSDYAYGSGGWTCSDSEYSDWLDNGQYSWTRSAASNNSASKWIIDNNGGLHYSHYDYINYCGVRPVITISKSDLKSLGY